MKKRPFLLLSGAFVFGEVCCHIHLTAALAALILLACASAVVATDLLPSGLASRVDRCFGKSRRPLWLLLLPVLFAAGILRMADESRWSGVAAQVTETGVPVKVRVVLQVDEIRQTDYSLQFYTRTIPELTGQNSDAPISHNELYGAVVTLKGDEETASKIEIGDLIRGEGTFSLFDAATNFGQFDMRGYYKAQGLEGRLRLERWDREPGRGPGKAVANLVYRGKEFLLGRLSLAAGEDGGLLGAILTGDKRGISDEDRRLFQENGISHMYAVSGLHASFVGWGLYSIWKKLGFRRSVCSAGACAGLWLLVTAAGGSVSVKRAFVMFMLSQIGTLAGRTYDLPVSLSAAAMIILWERPLMLFQSGFQLSFCAVAGIAIAAGAVRKGDRGETALCTTEKRAEESSERQKTRKPETSTGKEKIWKKKGIKNREEKTRDEKKKKSAGQWAEKIEKGMAVSLWMQLILLPSTLWNFFQYPCYGIFLNLIVIPTLSVVLSLGFLAAAFSCVWLSGARYCLLPVRGIFWLWRVLCRAAGRLPGALWITGRPKPVLIGIFLSFLFVFRIYSGKKRWGTARWYSLCLSLLLVGSLALFTRKPEAGFQVTFLDVGQGDGIYMREESGYVLMIDGGSSDVRNVGESRILPMIKASGNSQIDDWFLSHPDSDHCSGLKELLSAGFPIKRLWIPEIFRGDETVSELEELARTSGTQVRYARPGILLREKGAGIGDDDGITLTCLYPEADEPAASANDGSMVLLARYDGVGILFTGDLEASGESRLLARSPGNLLSCHILKTGHHGSKGSTSQPFLEALSPSVAVISCGQGNSYGHPHPQLLTRLEEQGCQIFTTMEYGAVTLQIFRGKIYLRQR